MQIKTDNEIISLSDYKRRLKMLVSAVYEGVGKEWSPMFLVSLQTVPTHHVSILETCIKSLKKVPYPLT